MTATSATYRSVVWLGMKTSRVVLVLGSVFLILLLAGLLPFLLAADISAFGRFPQGVRVGGVYVGKLNKREAVARCREELAVLAAKPLRLKIDDEAYSITPAEIGLGMDYRRMVDEAYNRAWNVNIIERMARRFLNRPAAMNLPILVTCDRKKVSVFVKRAMGSINRSPRNAYIDISTGKAVIVPALDGREADFDQVLAGAMRALDTRNRTVNVPLVKRTPPKVKEVTVRKFILANLGEHTLSLYDRDALLAKYPIACGSKEWPTAIGEWAVVKAEKNPTWYNRGSTWADNMPDSIPPGPGNPLGTRAITINGGGVLIHGTTDTGSIGYSVSHGCIRMYIGDVEALFNHLYIGMPVYIIKRSGEPGFDCSKKPFWKK